jgi:hypothetical protein
MLRKVNINNSSWPITFEPATNEKYQIGGRWPGLIERWSAAVSAFSDRHICRAPTGNESAVLFVLRWCVPACSIAAVASRTRRREETVWNTRPPMTRHIKCAEQVETVDCFFGLVN